jgi:hypothetical protein
MGLKTKAKLALVSLLAPFVIGSMTNALAEESSDLGLAKMPVVEQVESTQSVFAGSILNANGENSSVDSQVKYDNANGARLLGESVNHAWSESPSDNYRLGLRTPWVSAVRGSSHLESNRNYFNKFNPMAHTSFLEVKTADELVGRGGVAQKVQEDVDQLDVGFAGLDFKNKYLSVDGNLWSEGVEINAMGYVAGIVPIEGTEGLYLSVGGDSKKGNVNSLVALLNSDGPGFYYKNTADTDDHVYGGKLLIAPQQLDKGRGFFDFVNHIINGTHLGGVATGQVLDGWGPFDAFLTNGVEGNYVVVGNWASNRQINSGGLSLQYRANQGLAFGAGLGNTFVRETGENNPNMSLEIYSVVPNTPLDAWVKIDQNLRTGEVTSEAYLGLSAEF